MATKSFRNSTPLNHSIHAACHLLGIGRTKFYTLMNAGEIKTIHLGRKCLVPHSELLALQERKLSESKPTSDR
jgi:excisionase family DNA binding protein